MAGRIWSELQHRVSDTFSCFSDPGRRFRICLKAALVMVHMLYIGVLFVVDQHLLLHTARHFPCYFGLYLLLFVLTLTQYFITCYTSPGYVVDAMRAFAERHSSAPLLSEQTATSKNGGLEISVDGNSLGRSLLGGHPISWSKLVMEMYPEGSSMRQWTCSACNVLQPPRAKHCYDCGKCVLQYDHHCVWLGTCIGQANHCRFWWYIFEETTLCLWSAVLYIAYLKANISRSWWMDAIVIVLLISLSITSVFLVLLLVFHSYLVLTNQTTYELVRRRRIPYMRGVPERVYPFSKGICRNIYEFCARSSVYNLEPLPSAEQLAVKSRTVAFSDVLCCRCC